MILAVIAAPQISSAQALEVNPQVVWSCYLQTGIGAPFPDCLGQGASLCENAPQGSTTSGMATCTQEEAAVWDVILNEIYTEIQNMNAAADEAGLSPLIDRTDALRTAQRAWIAFRDAECAARYAMWQDGTIRSLEAAACHMTLTAQRAMALREMRRP